VKLRRTKLFFAGVIIFLGCHGSVQGQFDKTLCKKQSKELHFDIKTQDSLSGDRSGKSSFSVSKKGKYINFSFGDNVQRIRNSEDPTELSQFSARLMTLGLLYPKKLEKILFIGLGSGQINSYLHQFAPEIEITCLEVKSEVVKAVENYFGLSPDQKIVTEDVWEHLQNTKERYDIIILDFDVISSLGKHSGDLSLYRLIRSKLVTGGVFVGNFLTKIDRSPSDIREVLLKVFDHVDGFNVREEPSKFEEQRSDDAILISYNGPPKTEEILLKRTLGLQKKYNFRYNISELFLCWY